MTEGFITTADGVRLFYRQVGNGAKTLMVLNGFYLFDDFVDLAADRTVIFLDLRNRGRSDQVTDGTRLKRGVQQDVDDIEAVRRQLGIHQFDLIGHSYAGIIVILYAMNYPAHVDRIVQLGPMPPNATTQYPPDLSNADATLRDFLAKAGALMQERPAMETAEFCRKFWTLLRVIYVADPVNAERIHWDHCELPTELNFMKYWLENILPSIHALHFTADSLRGITAEVLTIHGVKDRSAAYGGGRDWAMMLPNGRLIRVENAAHAPWIEEPELVFGAIQTFLEGSWPETALRLDHCDSSLPPSFAPQ